MTIREPVLSMKPGERWDKPMRCGDMKKGQIYVCEDCGMELEVIKECTCGQEDACTCTPDQCELKCCDKPLKRAKSKSAR